MVDFERNPLPVVDWVGIRLGYVEASTVESELAQYDLTVDEVRELHDVDLDYHLNQYGVNYLIDKQDYLRDVAREERLQNGGLSDAELHQRFDSAMQGYGSKSGSYDLEY